MAAPAAGLRRARLPLHRARHARLRPLEHLRAPRGLRAGADRGGHARAAGVARPRQGGVDRPRLGQPGGVEHGGAPSRQDGRRGEPLRALSRGGLHARERGCRWSTARSIPRPSIPAGQWDYQFFYEENFDKALQGLRGQHPQRGEGAVPQGQSRRRRQARRTASVRKDGGWFGGGACPDLPRDGDVHHRAGSRGLYRGADAQRLLRAELLVHEPQGQRRLRQARAERRQARDAGAVPARRLRHDLRDHDTRGSPSRCAATAPTSPRSW